MKNSTRKSLHVAAQTIMLILKGAQEATLEDSPYDDAEVRGLVREKLARIIGQMIYDLPQQFTGKISTSLCDTHGYRLHGAKICYDHFYSRLRSGRQIIFAFDRGDLTFDMLVALLNKYRQVHAVTVGENAKLSRIQNGNYDLSHTDHYQMAGIVLVDDIGRHPAGYWNVYRIDGHLYNNLLAASNTLSVSQANIRKRCASKAKRWAGWTSTKRERWEAPRMDDIDGSEQ